jgi:hypothetical protein
MLAFKGIIQLLYFLSNHCMMRQKVLLAAAEA